MGCAPFAPDGVEVGVADAAVEYLELNVGRAGIAAIDPWARRGAVAEKAAQARVGIMD